MASSPRQISVVLLASVLTTAWTTGALAAQGVPKSFRELKSRVDGARNTSAVIRELGHLAKFRTSAAREFILKGLKTYKDESILSTLYRALAVHSHAHALRALENGFKTSKNDKVLDGVVAGLSGQGRKGQAVLERGLLAKSSLTRNKALSALSRVADKNGAVNAMIKAFGSAGVGFKNALLAKMTSMGVKGGTASAVLKVVFGVLDKERSVSLRLAALQALGKQSGSRVLKALRNEFERSKNPQLVNAAADSLVGLRNPGISVLLAALDAKDKLRREAAIRGLGKATKNRQATRALIDQFRAGSPVQQVQILGLLYYHESSTELTALRLEALDSKTVRIRCEALFQLAREEHRAVAEAALVLAEDQAVHKDDHMAGQVFFALGRNLTRDAVGPFLALARKRGYRTDAHWRSILKTDAKRVLKLVSDEGLRIPDEALRMIAVNLLAKADHDGAVRGLLRAMDDTVPQVVVVATRALIARKHPKVVAILEGNLDSPDQNIKVQALLGLHEFRKSSPAWGARLLKILRNTDGPSRLVALGLLTEIKLRAALGDVQEVFMDKAWQMRSAAYYFCLHVRDKSSIPLLIKRLPEEDGRLRAEILGTLRALTNLTYREASQWQRWWDAEGGTFVVPPAPKKLVGRSAAAAMTYYSIPITSNRVCFIVDTSGSMQEKMRTAKVSRLEVAKKALQEVIRRCNEKFHFNLITFGSVGKRWKRELQPALVKNKESARVHVKEMRPAGGTNVFEALFMAFQDESVDTIYLLSDGYPTQGDIVDPQELADEIQRWNATRTIVINTIAIGTDSALLRRLAEDSDGTYVRQR